MWSQSELAKWTLAEQLHADRTVSLDKGETKAFVPDSKSETYEGPSASQW